MKIRLLLTDTCNAHCLGCHNEGQLLNGKFMDFHWIQKFIKSLSLINVNIEEIILSGGEPTLHPHIIDIIHYIRENINCYLSINSNGMVKDKLISIYPLVDEVKFHIESNISSQYESLMGLNYNRMLNVLSLLPDYNKLTICTIARDEEQVKSLIQLSYSLPGSSLKFSELSNELIPTPSSPISVYTLSDLSLILLQYNYSLVTPGNHLHFTRSLNNSIHHIFLRQCIDLDTPTFYIDSNHHIRMGFDFNKIDLYPIVMNSTSPFNSSLFSILNPQLEIEYRWCIPQSFFKYLKSSFNQEGKFEYQFDLVFNLHNNDTSFFRIKERGNKLSFDIKSRSPESDMFNEMNLEFNSYEEALSYGNSIGTPTLKLDKFRTEFKISNSFCSLDYVPSLGYFIEVEGPDSLSVSNQLGLLSYPPSKPYGYYLERNLTPTPININI